MENTIQHLYPWAYEMQGAKKMLHFLVSNYRIDLMPEIPKTKGREAYQKALYNWLMEDLTNIEKFLSGAEIRFTDHIQDSKGKCIGCKVICKE